MTNNTLSLSKLIVFLLLIYSTIAQLEFFNKFFLKNIVIIIINYLICMYLIVNNKDGYNLKYIYMLPFVLFFSFFTFYSFGNNLFADIYRVNLFCSFFLCVFFLSNNINSVFFLKKHTINFYFIISLLIIFDMFLFFITGRVFLFNVMIYITPRFIGPFYDPNFLGFIYGALFLIVYFERTYNKLYGITFLICTILSGSWIVIGLLTLILIQVRVFSFRYTFLKPVICVFVVILFWFVYEYLLDDVYFLFKYLVGNLAHLSEQLIDIKFKSLEYRFEVTNMAVNLIIDNPFGYGYRTITKYLPLDTHNSYLGISFEYGIGALLLLIIPFFMMGINRSVNVDSLTSFICFMALFLNVHYLPIYLFFVITVYFPFGEKRLLY